jgi:hypothetical protein
MSTRQSAGLFVRERGLFMSPQNKGRFYHDGRFQTLLDVVNSYNDRLPLKSLCIVLPHKRLRRWES